MIYLDNSSTTFKKPRIVKKTIIQSLNKYSTNPSRASYQIALKSAQKVFETREKIAQFFNAKQENVIFTSGCTTALNLAIMGTSQKNGHIITTIFEHNSVLRPLEKLKKTHNISVSYIKPDENLQISIEKIEKEIKSNTYMIIINHTSNVTGTTQNIKDIGKIAKKHKLIFLVDAAQSAGHEKIDIKENNINLLAIAGHKGFYAAEGIGALIINNTKVSPLILGGTGTFSNSLTQPTDYPDGLESGTPNLPGILSLNAGVEFVNKNFKKINTKIYNLTKYLINQLSKIPNIKFWKNEKTGIVSIYTQKYTSTELSSILDDKYNIATRSGLHCAPLVHKYLNTTQNGLTRISLSYFNKKTEIKKLIKALKNTIK